MELTACDYMFRPHAHVACWNCGKEHCMAYRRYAGLADVFYSCSCDCAEYAPVSRYAIVWEQGFDREFAARMVSPA